MTEKGLTSVKRPDNQQEEQHVVKVGWHVCPGQKKREPLFFPVGAAGSAHPNHHPFEVASIPCEHCSVVVTCWFEWKGATIIDLGAK